MTAIERKLPEMNGQVSQVLEGMDKLNAKVESFMQQIANMSRIWCECEKPKNCCSHYQH
jgi:hypothetical protein